MLDCAACAIDVHDLVARPAKIAAREDAIESTAERAVERTERCRDFAGIRQQNGGNFCFDRRPVDAARCELHESELRGEAC